jgi:CBS domain-containing protein
MQDGVTVKDVMSREFVGVNEGDEVSDLLELMVTESISSVVVLRGSRPVGVVHDLDVLELVSEQGDIDETTVSDLMRTPPEPVAPDDGIETALDRLSTGWDRQLPVTDEDQLVGVVSESDVLAAAASLFATAGRTEPERPKPQPNTAETGTGGGSLESSPLTDDPYTNHDGTAAVGTADPSMQSQSDTVSTQGVCESCGSLVGNLGELNGQLLCRECRDV